MAWDNGSKVVIFGSINVGKTTLLSCITHNRFDPNTEATTRAGSVHHRPPSDDLVAIQFWDTAGTEATGRSTGYTIRAQY
jgi:small GTP-binding protein